jgi:hypothetical protein
MGYGVHWRPYSVGYGHGERDRSNTVTFYAICGNGKRIESGGGEEVSGMNVGMEKGTGHGERDRSNTRGDERPGEEDRSRGKEWAGFLADTENVNATVKNATKAAAAGGPQKGAREEFNRSHGPAGHGRPRGSENPERLDAWQPDGACGPAFAWSLEKGTGRIL